MDNMTGYQLLVIFIAVLNSIAIPFVNSIFTRMKAQELALQEFELEIAKQQYVTKLEMRDYVKAEFKILNEKLADLKEYLKENLNKN